MADSILELIPERLREDLIKEIKEKIKEEEDSYWKIPPTQEQINEVVKNLMP